MVGEESELMAALGDVRRMAHKIAAHKPRLLLAGDAYARRTAKSGIKGQSLNNFPLFAKRLD